MKASHFLTIILIAASSSLLQAAPAISVKDLSADSLQSVATPQQQASLKEYNDAKAEAENQREQDIQNAKDITKANDEGLKKTIIKRSLNNMLPPCERNQETPRDPAIYEVR